MALSLGKTLHQQHQAVVPSVAPRRWDGILRIRIGFGALLATVRKNMAKFGGRTIWIGRLSRRPGLDYGGRTGIISR